MAMIPVEQARAIILDSVTPYDAEDVALSDALGRTLARAIASRTDQPPFDASAMDGYAVRSGDCREPGATLTVIGEAAAGHVSGQRVARNEALRIFTGAAVPEGADAVVIQENVTRDGNTITISERAAPGANIRPRAQDLRNGHDVLSPGQRLAPRHILLAAAAGHATLPCVRQPSVALLSTGDELVEPGNDLAPGQIYSSNSYGLAALVTRFGGVPRVVPRAGDSRDSLNERLAEASDSDLLVTIGGASVGDHDLVRACLTDAGADLEFYKVAMRPGKPVFFGSRPTPRGRQRIVGLPGNPVSAMVSARVFLVPLLLALLGRSDDAALQSVTLATPIDSNGPRTHFMRGRLKQTGDGPRVHPVLSQDSSMVRLLAEANCLIVVPANTDKTSAGETVSVMSLDI